MVVLTVLADDYAELTNQLMCSLQRVNLSQHALIVADEAKTCAGLLPTWRSACIGGSLGRGTMLYDYGTDGFRRVAQMKPLATRVAIEHGVDVLFADGDITFLRNPLSSLYAKEVDLAVQDDGERGMQSTCPRGDDDAMARRRISDATGRITLPGLNVNSGFYLLRASERAVTLMNAWLESMRTHPNYGPGDQIHLNVKLYELCHKTSQSNVSWAILDRYSYPNGYVTFYTDRDDEGRLVRSWTPPPLRIMELNPLMVHFNFFVGIGSKLEAIYKSKLHFVRDGQCSEPPYFAFAQNSALLPMVHSASCEQGSRGMVRRYVETYNNGSLFNGAGQDNYRLADILYGKADGCQLRDNISATFPGSLAALYLEHDPDLPCHNNTDRQNIHWQLLAKLSEQFLPAHDDTTWCAVHVRAGDVVDCDAHSIQELLLDPITSEPAEDAPDGCFIRDRALCESRQSGREWLKRKPQWPRLCPHLPSGGDYVRPLASYVEALRGSTCQNLHIITGSYMDMPSGFPRSEAYLQEIYTHLNCRMTSSQNRTTHLRIGRSPDEDFAMMVHAEVFVRSAGGFDDLLDGTREYGATEQISELVANTRRASQLLRASRREDASLYEVVRPRRTRRPRSR